MTHLTMEQLLAVREGDASQAALAHLDGCAACQAEHDRLAQRIAGLRALPARRPPRDRWPVVRRELRATRRRKLLLTGGLAMGAAAASLAVALLAPDDRPTAPAPHAEVARYQRESRELEQLLATYGTEGRVVDARTAAVIADLEDRIGLVDVGLSDARVRNASVHEVADLWRGRVELMGALVNVHVARASYVGF